MEITKEYLEELIKKFEGNKKRIREVININPAGLQNLMSKHDLLELSEEEKVEKEYLRMEYLVKGKLIKDIAEELGVTKDKISGKIYKYALSKPSEVIDKLNKEYLEEEYLVKGRSAKDIAEELGVKRTRVTSAIYRLGLSGNKVEELPEHVTVEKVRELYVCKDLTREDVAKELGISLNQLNTFLRNNGLTNIEGKNKGLKTYKTYEQPDRRGELKLSEEYVREEYLDKRRSAYDIAREHNLTDCEIEYMLERYELYGKKGFIKHICNEDKFSIEDPIFCYYAGLVATDGYIDIKNKRVVLRICNEGAEILLNHLADYFEFTGEVRTYPQYGEYTGGRDQIDLTITSEKLIEELNKLNIPSVNKTYDLKFPDNFFNDECAKMYIRGVVDGDGTITGFLTNVGFTLVCDSKEFVKGVIEFINNEFNIDENLRYQYSHANRKNYPRCYIGANRPIAIMDWIYGGNIKYVLPEKYEKYREFRENILY